MFGVLKLGKLGASMKKAGFNPRTLFSAAEPGAWYDPSDLSTLFQDSAGTTPVTAVEQPVGLILDKSGNGHHAIQATTTKRPVYSRRVNLLVGSTTLATQSITTRAADYKIVFSGTGSVTLSGTATGVYGAGTNSITCTAGTLTLTVSGAVQDASFHLAIDLYLPYQRVNTATDYDADPAKFPAYLKFDGVDDAMQTGNIDFTSTDKMTVWAGVTKLSDAAAGVVVELSTSQAANTGSFYLAAPYSAGPNVGFLARGTINTSAPAADTTWVAPASLVATGQGLIGAAVPNILRTTGKPERVIANSIGTGNYGNYPLYIGARAGTSTYFNGRLYSLIVRGAQSSLSQIEATELYVKQKMRLP